MSRLIWICSVCIANLAIVVFGALRVNRASGLVVVVLLGPSMFCWVVVLSTPYYLFSK